jgi:CubicO group peptidase (beta-lactamase class C family)
MPKLGSSGAALTVALILCCSLGLVAQALPPQLATPKQIHDMLVERIDVEHKSDGIVVGVIDKHEREIISYGKFDPNDPRAVDGETVFEIGSITKVFTALLLSDMALRGEVKLKDPVQKYLPASVHMPSRDGKQITLLDLADHHSGLPGQASNYNNTYTTEEMYAFLDHYTLTRDPGAKYEYSNFGMGLLGQVLARRAGTDYETLLRTRITGPLGMTHTAVYPTPEMQAHLTPGHGDGIKSPPIPIDAMEAAGAIRSNLDDMFIFLAANMGLMKTPLHPAMKPMLKVRRPGPPGVEVGLGWHIVEQRGTQAARHNGQTYGYHSFLAFEPRRQVGVVVLSNSSVSIDDIGWRILDYPQPTPHVVHVGPANAR